LDTATALRVGDENDCKSNTIITAAGRRARCSRAEMINRLPEVNPRQTRHGSPNGKIILPMSDVLGLTRGCRVESREAVKTAFYESKLFKEELEHTLLPPMPKNTTSF